MEANEAIVNAVANNSRPPFWLGLVSTPEKPSTFRYMSNGLAPYYTNWDSAQPDNDKGIEYCSQITYKDRYVFQGFHQVWYQGIVTATVSGVLEDLTFS